MIRALPAAIAVLAAVAGCSSSSIASSRTAPPAAAPAGNVQAVTIDTTNTFRFDPSTVAVHVGAVRITLHDVGSYPHNLSVRALHATSGTVSGDPGQQSKTLTVTFLHPGTYTFVCTYHSSAGMRGRFVVTQ